MYQETDGDVVPLCKKSCGCPIEDLATDEEINEIVNNFEIAKALFKASELPSTQESIFKRIGLLDDPLLHLELEFIYAEDQHLKQINNIKR